MYDSVQNCNISRELSVKNKGFDSIRKKEILLGRKIDRKEIRFFLFFFMLVFDNRF